MTGAIRRERRLVRRFQEAGAFTPDSARSLEQIGIADSRPLRRLRDRLVIRHTEDGRFYMDEEGWAVLGKRRRRHASAAAIIALAVLLAMFLFGRTAHAQGPARADIDAIFSDWNKPTSPGCALGVYRDGKVAYERGYGSADLEHDVPITPATVFYVGSLSKQFTAMAAALAIQQGRMAADDPVRKYLPELPMYADRITIRHLIHHTSGLRDYNTLLAIAGRRGDEAYDNATVLRMTARQKGLNFEPGSEYLYSNTGYTLLASIVERATKTPFAVFAETNIFKPLGMSESHFHTDASRLVRGRAMAYQAGQNGALRLDTPSNERAGAGGVFTSIRELLQWDENFYTGKAGGKELIAQLQTPGRLSNGNVTPYAWGLQIGRYRGLPVVEHGGSLGGYRAHLLRFPEQHTSVAALCNIPNGPGSLVRQVADVVLGQTFTQPRPAAPAAASARPQRPVADTGSVANGAPLADYAGTYTSDEIDATFIVEMGSSGLVLARDTSSARLTLARRQVDTFETSGFTIQFVRAGGRVTSLLVDAGRVRDIRFDRAR
jgi:CubicO group peptidase (beta-lactamase class C family)